MARLNLLTPDELANREQKPTRGRRSGRKRSEARTRIIESFKAELQDASPGYGVDVNLSEGEDKRLVRMNLKAAAEELGIALDFRPIKDPNRMHMRVISLEQKAAMPYRGGGRPRKVQPDAVQETIAEPQQGTNGNGTEPEAAPAPRARRRRTQQQASAE